MDITATVKAHVEIMGIELLALKKLSLVSHALGKRLGGAAQREQDTLVSVLDKVILQIELAHAMGAE